MYLNNFIKSIWILLFLLSIAQINSSSEGDEDLNNSCSSTTDLNTRCQNKVDHEKEKYFKQRDKKWEKYYKLIEDAETRFENDKKELNHETGCSCYTRTISNDLQPFKSGISKQLIDDANNRGTLYQIVDGVLYREKECKFPSRCNGVEHFLLKIANKMTKNTEFVVNVFDWPQVPIHQNNQFPVFSFSKTTDYLDITYPAWSFWEGGPAIETFPRGIGRWDLLRASLLDAAKQTPWRKKKPVGFFRGSRTSGERDALVLLSRKNPSLVDAKFTKNQAWKSIEDTLGEPAVPVVSFEDHCKFKYLFNYRGVAASFRFKHLFLCNSLVLHANDEWIEFFYPSLVPWIHYVPLNKDARGEEIKELLEFFIENDYVGERIALRGHEFIVQNLNLGHIECYWDKLLRRYSKLLDYSVTLRPGTVPVAKAKHFE